MKIRIFILTFISFYSLHIFAQNQSYTDKYSLHSLVPRDTTTVYSWRFSAATTISCIPMVFTENRQQHLLFLHPQHYPFAEKLEVGCEQRIWLPLQNEKRGRISLTSKGQNIESARLIISGINKYEKVLYVDTLRFKADSILETASIDFSLIGVELLDMSIVAEGIKKKRSSLSVTRVDVTLGEQPIDAFSLRESEPQIDSQDYKMIPLCLNSAKGFNKVEALKAHKIIALGESTHGSSDIKKTASLLTQHQVSQNKCRLVMYEIPLELSIFFNRYIQDPMFECDKIGAYGTELAHLLEWLRNYNADRSESDKVSFLGMDYIWQREKKTSTANSLSEYLALLNKKVQSKKIDTLCRLLQTEPWSKSISFMEQQKEQLEKLLPSVDLMLISHTLNLSYSMGSDRNERLILRDSVMFENAKWLIKQFCSSDKTAFMYGHSGHLNLISSYPTVIPIPPLGAMMSHYYKDGFYSMTILIGNGFLSLPNMKRITKSRQLPNAPTLSIEGELSKIEQDASFIPISTSLDKLILSRSISSIFTNQGFYPFNLYRRHHGLIFIRNNKN